MLFIHSSPVSHLSPNRSFSDLLTHCPSQLDFVQSPAESLPAGAQPGRGLSLPEIRRLLWRLWLRVPATARAILA